MVQRLGDGDPERGLDLRRHGGHRDAAGAALGACGLRLQKSSGLPLEVFAAAAGVTPVCDRTVQVRDAIVAAVSGVSACANVTAAHLAAITQLDLASTGISSLQAGDFDGLTALLQLNLERNSLSELPAGVFDGLTALTLLNLGRNSLSPAGGRFRRTHRADATHRDSLSLPAG